MKLKTIKNRARAPKTASISFNKKNGVIIINQDAGELLGITAGDTLSLSQDEERPKDWYISKGGGLRVRNSNSGSLATGGKYIACKLFESLGLYSDKSVRFPIAEQPTEYEGKRYFAILTAAL